jgi:hypothetical protein
MKVLNYIKALPLTILKGINESNLIGFIKSVHALFFRSIKQPAIFHGYKHETFARWYRVKRELLYHHNWNQMGKEQFILKFVPGKLIVCSKLELEVYKKKGLLSKNASIRKITHKSL